MKRQPSQDSLLIDQNLLRTPFDIEDRTIKNVYLIIMENKCIIFVRLCYDPHIIERQQNLVSYNFQATQLNDIAI